MADRLAREGALDPQEDERVRAAVRKLVVETGSQSAAAKKIGVSQQTVSRHLHGFPAGRAFAAKVATAAKADIDELLGRYRIDYDPGEARAPAFGLLPGWADAEAAARATWKGRAIPEEAWKLAREAAGALTPAQVTPIFVLGLAEAFAEAVATKGEK